jgi:hypothetical protein
VQQSVKEITEMGSIKIRAGNLKENYQRQQKY